MLILQEVARVVAVGQDDPYIDPYKRMGAWWALSLPELSTSPTDMLLQQAALVSFPNFNFENATCTTANPRWNTINGRSGTSIPVPWSLLAGTPCNIVIVPKPIYPDGSAITIQTHGCKMRYSVICALITKNRSQKSLNQQKCFACDHSHLLDLWTYQHQSQGLKWKCLRKNEIEKY